MIFPLTIFVADSYITNMNGDELKLWRRQRKVTQQQLAQMLGVHRVTVAKWECGARSIPSFLPLTLEALENRLGQQPTALAATKPQKEEKQ